MNRRKETIEFVVFGVALLAALILGCALVANAADLNAIHVPQAGYVENSALTATPVTILLASSSRRWADCSNLGAVPISINGAATLDPGTSETIMGTGAVTASAPSGVGYVACSQSTAVTIKSPAAGAVLSSPLTANTITSDNNTSNCQGGTGYDSVIIDGVVNASNRGASDCTPGGGGTCSPTTITLASGPHTLQIASHLPNPSHVICNFSQVVNFTVP